MHAEKPNQTSHNTELRRQNGKTQRLDSCSVTKRPEGELGREQKQQRDESELAKPTGQQQNRREEASKQRTAAA